ncbi:MATE family efflux transporter [Leptolyngbya sp. PCC 6406]|uniref:MATE family efflux transporter n=1 Tax=Leptolyngbya sp. PCC 6406 TaxID=1173264 RepID=UPI0002ACE8B0|nr:MATE family efflux transporter [Leptolyngbya sp. PCC 6406]
MLAFSKTTALRTEAHAFLKLAIPLSSAQVAQAMTGFVDTVMMGWLGQTTLAAGGLAVMLFTSFLFTGVGVLSSISPLVAAAYGAGRRRQVGPITHQGLWLAVLLSLVSLPAIAHLDGLMLHFGQDPVVVDLADRYLGMARWGLLPALGFAVLRGSVTALSQAKPIMVIVVAANLLNIAGNYLLAFGKLGFPALGMEGLALASSLAHGTMFLALLGYMVWNLRGHLADYGLFQRLHHLDWPLMGRVLNLGLPIGFSTVLEHGLFTVITFMMGALGTAVLAANQLALQTVVVVFMVPLAMSYAATIRVGQWFGRGDWLGVRRAAIASVGLSAGFMGIAAIALISLSRPLIGLYLDLGDPMNQEVLQVGTALLMVAGVGQVVDGIQRTANGVLQGLQDTRVPLLFGVIAYWGVGLTSSYWLGFHTPLAGIGVWIGSYIGLTLAAIAYVVRFWVLLNRGQRRLSVQP